MKKIEFGFNDDERLNATWSGIEFYNGEYLDTINSRDMDFLVTRIVDSHKGLNGSIDVREVTQDYYADGSYVTYANKEKNSLCRALQDYLNSSKIRDRLNNERPLDILRSEFPVYTSHLLRIEAPTEEFPEVVTSIKPEMFKKLKDSKRYHLGASIYYLTEEVKRLNEEIQKLKEENKKERHH